MRVSGVLAAGPAADTGRWEFAVARCLRVPSYTVARGGTISLSYQNGNR